MTLDWDSKKVFVISRGLLSIFGVARTVAIIRMVTLTDYALIGIVESIRSIVGTLLGFGSGDSLAREGATERDPKRLGQLLAVSYANSFGLSVPIGIAFFVIALFSGYFSNDQRLPSMLAAAFAVSLLERCWNVSLTALRVLDCYRAFILFGFAYGILNTVISVTLVATLGVVGYFYAQVANGTLMVTLLGVIVVRRSVLPCLHEFIDSWKEATTRLWSVSWFMYMFKGSTVLWRRLAILISAPFVSPQVLGAVSAALDLGFKIHLLHQALSPLIIPRLSRAYAESTHRYLQQVRIELREVIALNVAAILLALLGWRWLGEPLLTPERWNSIGALFYLALAVEITLVVANISIMCVLVPTKRLDSVTVLTSALRLATLPVFCLLFVAGLVNGPLILLSMLVPGILVAALYWQRACAVLRALARSRVQSCST